MGSDESLNLTEWFISKMNYVLDCLDFKLKMINQIIPKIENIFEYKYDQQYGQSNIISNTVKAIWLAIRSKQYN